MPLVLTRKPGQSVSIAGPSRVVVNKVRGQQVSLVFLTDADVVREEVERANELASADQVDTSEAAKGEQENVATDQTGSDGDT